MPIPTDATVTASTKVWSATTTATIASPGGDATTDFVVPMTTPFSMPPGCLDFDGAAMYTQLQHYDSSDQNVTHLTRNFYEMDTQSCWPSGVYNATYSPAVCPSGWTYYSIMPGDYDEPVTVTESPSDASTAYATTSYTNQISAVCCPSGFELSVLTWSTDTNIDHVCSRTVTSGELSIIVTNQPDGSPTLFQGSATLMIPTPMTVSWNAEDASTLTPQPPDIPVYSFAPSWVPGQSVTVYDKVRYDDSPRNNRLATGVFAAVIAVPIVLFLAILGCCICCFRIRRRREKREIAKEQEESQALATERTSTQERTPNHSTDGEADTAEEEGPASETVAAVAASPSVNARQVSADVQRPAAQDPAGGNTNVHPLSDISKPPYPGLPSQGFDGIEEPPPYVEAAPSYPLQSSSATAAPTSPTQDGTTRDETINRLAT
ncbi:uncharacterized protein BBA_00043 [Beauveria bassiana ARSEF 2860]|uniref:Uncharacterized protein n=1 Tax=Beauveria bassiana (strain ARSEF 2860) TaxID=655819 RepID=J5K1W2_BEAB2|nr:uncharacterized protein BBA_00043 [Beauveria bassiana ARSEF 2860]EJP70413.1 hypothetical protein BBA_00043 [Beauveria bassiana ARSEF 2860]